MSRSVRSFPARVFAVVPLLVALLAGCPKNGPGAPAPVAFGPAAAVPADAIAVARLDVPTVLARPVMPRR